MFIFHHDVNQFIVIFVLQLFDSCQHVSEDKVHRINTGRCGDEINNPVHHGKASGKIL